MRRLFVLLSILALTSCDNDDILPTGDITVSAGLVTAIDGTPIGQTNVGLFDINVLITNRFTRDEALVVKIFMQGTVNFTDLNPGNYVVAIMSSNSYRQAVQVSAGKTATVNIFE